ncbi:MAG: S8 family serine peptidase, partial [Myxococcales bacterium]|nr:S8 family serine peptidase [Myxococcales bacterium]
MPVKVLDERNRGTEWALVEGLHHAIDNGADVINLSLSFPLGYVASPALEAALERAWREGVVVVAAAGNDGAAELTWPAASRVVIAVGASLSDSGPRRFQAEGYSNLSPALDVLAPGGSLDRDADHDGWPDGLLAETIDPSDPGHLGYWFYEGTSQAAALASGAAARLLAAGVAPHDVAASLQSGAGGYDPHEASLSGSGAGPVDVAGAIGSPAAHRDVYAGLLPYLTAGGPEARVAVVDERGEPVVGAPVVGTVSSASQVQWWSCVTDDEGRCDLAGPGWRGTTDAWAFRVDGVVLDGVAQRPGRAMFASDAAAVLLAALSEAPEAEGGLLAVHWSAGRDEVLDANLQDAWSVVDSGTGLLSSPLGLLFDSRHLAGSSDAGTIDLDLDGTGLLSSPLGLRATASTLWIDGSGLLSSPLGLRSSLLLVGIEGSGLLSSPLGFHASDLYVLGGSGLISSPLGLGWYGQTLLLDSGSLLGSSVAGSPWEGLVDGTLTRDAGGLEPASWLVASGSVSVGLAPVPPPDRRPVDRAPVPYRP